MNKHKHLNMNWNYNPFMIRQDYYRCYCCC